MTTSDIGARVEEVRDRITRAALESGRAAHEITLVAVAKTFPADMVAAAVRAGCIDIGENRAQELKQKAAVLHALDIRWHFVGPLQSNKVRLVVGTAALIHSVDRPGLGAAIARRAEALGITQDVLVEVNVGGEPGKAGVEPRGAAPLARALEHMDGLAVRGVMAIPPLDPDPEEQAEAFRSVALVGAEVAAEVPGANHLSMGMSRDFEIAIGQGATIVRIGEAIFGPRTG
jgi:hypothetical protein